MTDAIIRYTTLTFGVFASALVMVLARTMTSAEAKTPNVRVV